VAPRRHVSDVIIGEIGRAGAVQETAHGAASEIVAEHEPAIRSDSALREVFGSPADSDAAGATLRPGNWSLGTAGLENGSAVTEELAAQKAGASEVRNCA
jgi:hypothetical protein